MFSGWLIFVDVVQLHFVDFVWVSPTNILCVSHFDTWFLSWLVLQAHNMGQCLNQILENVDQELGSEWKYWWLLLLCGEACLLLHVYSCILHLSTFCVLCMYHMYVTDVETCWNLTFTTFYTLWSRAINPIKIAATDTGRDSHNFGWCFTISCGHSSWWLFLCPILREVAKHNPTKWGNASRLMCKW